MAKKNVEKLLIAGVVDGRNIWVTDFEKALARLDEISQVIPKENTIISTSCSLLHTPYTVENEPESDVRKWLAFAVEKVDEIAILGEAYFGKDGSNGVSPHLEQNK